MSVAFTHPPSLRTAPEPLACAAADAEPRSFRARRHPTLEAAAPLWRMLQAGRTGTVYQRLDWAGLVAGHLARGAGRELVLVEVTDAGDDTPVMLLPLMLRRGRTHSVVEFLDCGVCDYGAPLAAPGTVFSASDMRHIWTAVLAVLPEADRVRLSRLAHRVGGAPNPLVLLHGTRRMALHASGAALSGDRETVVARTCSASNARDIRRSLRRLAALGAVRFVEARTPDEVDQLFAVLVEQRLARFRELGRFDLLNGEPVRAFYRAAARQGLSGGPARLLGLRVGEEWIATAYGLVHDGAFHGTLIGLGAACWRRFSPGLALIAETMAWCRENDLGYFDFTIGDMPYKSGFGIENRPLFEFTQALTLRGRLAAGIEAAGPALKARLAGHPALFEALRNAVRRCRRFAAPGSARGHSGNRHQTGDRDGTA